MTVHDEIKNATHDFVVYRPCGCVCILCVVFPGAASDIAKDTRWAIKKGLHFETIPHEKAKDLRWKCDTCRPPEVGP